MLNAWRCNQVLSGGIDRMGLEGWWGVECAAERCDVDGGVALRWYGSVV